MPSKIVMIYRYHAVYAGYKRVVILRLMNHSGGEMTAEQKDTERERRRQRIARKQRDRRIRKEESK